MRRIPTLLPGRRRFRGSGVPGFRRFWVPGFHVLGSAVPGVRGSRFQGRGPDRGTFQPPTGNLGTRTSEPEPRGSGSVCITGPEWSVGQVAYSDTTVSI